MASARPSRKGRRVNVGLGLVTSRARAGSLSRVALDHPVVKFITSRPGPITPGRSIRSIRRNLATVVYQQRRESDFVHISDVTSRILERLRGRR